MNPNEGTKTFFINSEKWIGHVTAYWMLETFEISSNSKYGATLNWSESSDIEIFV